MIKESKAACLNRLSRIEGQVRNLNRMLEEDRCRIDDATQIAAVRAAQRPMEEAILHAQEIGLPSARTVAIAGAVQSMKAELRNHTYDGNVLLRGGTASTI